MQSVKSNEKCSTRWSLVCPSHCILNPSSVGPLLRIHSFSMVSSTFDVFAGVDSALKMYLVSVHFLVYFAMD